MEEEQKEKKEDCMIGWRGRKVAGMTLMATNAVSGKVPPVSRCAGG